MARELDAWGKLWDIAIGCTEEGGPATIEVDPKECGYVTLVWADGTRGLWHWDDGEWNPVEGIDSAPADVAARDTL